MKKKNLFLGLLMGVAPVILCATILATNMTHYNFMFAETIHPGSITMDINDDSIDVGSSMTLKSAYGNEFEFESNGLSRTATKFNLTSHAYIGNVDILNGITSLNITASEDQTFYIDYKLNDFDNWEEMSTTSSTTNYVVSFTNYYPNYFRFYTQSVNGSFTKLVINYQCQADVPEYGIKRMFTHNAGNYRAVDMDGIHAPIGTPLTDITFSSELEIVTKDDRCLMYDHRPYDMTIEYVDSNSTTVLKGKQDVVVSFTHNGRRYTDTLYLLGYDHIGFIPDSSNAYFYPSEVRIKDNDYLPSDFRFSVYGDVVFYDDSDNELFTTMGSIYEKQLKESMLTSYTSNLFTSVGTKEITFTYEGQSYTGTYYVYDPDFCNIRNITYPDGLSVVQGTSNEDFLTYILSQTTSVSYFEYDGYETPSEITLTADNFTLRADMFADYGKVYVTIHYQNYLGSVAVNVTKAPGVFVKKYTNENGVEINIMGHTFVVTGILVYDDDTVKLETDLGGVGDEFFEYSIEDGLMTIVIEPPLTLQFEIDDVNNTFSEHAKVANPMFTVHTDFSALGADPDEYFDGVIYDDMTIVFDMYGMPLELAFTVDPNIDYTIFFNFPLGPDDSIPCQGVIDPDTMIMVVTALGGLEP